MSLFTLAGMLVAGCVPAPCTPQPLRGDGAGAGGTQPALGFEHLTPCSASEAHHCPRHQKRTSESTQLLALPSPSKGFTSHMSFRPPSPWEGKAGVINEGLVRGHCEFSKSWDWDPLLPMPTTLVKPWVHRLAACLQGPRHFPSRTHI